MELIKNLKLNKKIILIIAVVGIALMIIGGGGAREETDSLSDESRLEKILAQIEGVGEVKIMLSEYEQKNSSFSQRDSLPKYMGAIVLAEGGGKSDVKEKIIKAVNAITGLDAHKIVVYRLGN